MPARPQASNACRACGAGLYSAAGASNCLQCPAGSYSNTAASACLQCPKGFYTPRAATPRCIRASAGFLANANAGATGQVACAAGTFSYAGSSVGATASDTSECIPCPIGFFNNRVGSRNCTACPVGERTCTFGATSCQAANVLCVNPLPPYPPPRAPSPPPYAFT